MDMQTRMLRMQAIDDIRCRKARYCQPCDNGCDADALIALFADPGGAQS